MSREKRYAPNLKFEEFKNDGEWAPKKFANIVTRISATSDNNSLPRIEYEDIISSRGTLNKDIYRKNSIKKGIEFQSQDILFGKLRPYLKNWLFPDFTGIAVGDFWVFRSSDTNPKFIYSLIQTERYQRISNLSTGTKMPRSDWNIVSNTNFIIPKSMKEQKKIGSFFENIDKMIQLQQSKVNKVKYLKSAYLSEMFPKEGEKYPKKRFEGFTEPWTDKKLGSLLDYEQPTNYLVKSDSYDDSYLTPVLTAGKSFLLGYTNETEGIYKADNNNGVIIFDDFTTSSHFVDFDFKVKSSAMKFLRTNQSNFNLYFLYNLLTSINYSPESHERHWISIFSEFEVLVPTKKEQEKIAQLFKNLDNQISIEEKKLAKLEKLKQAYLNDMFV